MAVFPITASSLVTVGTRFHEYGKIRIRGLAFGRKAVTSATVIVARHSRRNAKVVGCSCLKIGQFHFVEEYGAIL